MRAAAAIRRRFVGVLGGEVGNRIRLARALRASKSHGAGPILHYSPDFSGGAAASIMDIADALPELNHLIVSERGFNPPWSRFLKGRKHVFPVQTSAGTNLYELINLCAPLAILNHVSWDLLPVTRTAVAHISPRPKVISFMHSRGVMARLTPDHADYVVIFSRHLEEPGIEAAFCPEANPRVICLPNHINEGRLVRLPLRGPARAGQFVVGNIASGGAWKHSDDFLDVCLSIDVPNIQFRFLGATDLTAGAGHLKQVEILPVLSEPLDEYLGSISVLVHRTSSEVAETWCRTVTEAMTAGVPVVAEAKGGIRDQIEHGRTGFLCRTSSDFKQYVEGLFSDESLYRRISCTARAHAVANFGLAACRRDLLRLLA